VDHWVRSELLARSRTHTAFQHHPERPPGQAQIAAAGGAGRWHAQRRGRATPPSGMHSHGFPGLYQAEDCHQSKQLTFPSSPQGADLHLCAPGRTRTCTSRIRSKTRPVQTGAPLEHRRRSRRVRRPSSPISTVLMPSTGLPEGLPQGPLDPFVPLETSHAELDGSGKPMPPATPPG
jgi:hypothetical protein